MEAYIKEKQTERDLIKAQTEAFLLSGGKVEVCESEATTDSYAYKAWNNIGLREVL